MVRKESSTQDLLNDIKNWSDRFFIHSNWNFSNSQQVSVTLVQKLLGVTASKYEIIVYTKTLLRPFAST